MSGYHSPVRLFSALVISFSVLLLMSCGNTEFQNNNAFSNENAGRNTYEALCSGCHGDDGRGLGTLATPAIDATKETYGGVSLERYIEANMQRGITCVGDCATSVAAYIRTWNPNANPTDPADPPEPPAPIVEDVDSLVGIATEGERLFTAQKCVDCHGAEGNGIYELIPNRNSYQHSSEPAQNYSLARYIETFMGPGSAPKCTQQCAADVAAFIQTWEVDSGSPGDGNGGNNGGGDNGGGDNGGGDNGGGGNSGGGDNGGGDNGSGNNAPDIANGKMLYESSQLKCSACHGVDGTSQLPDAPDLDATKALYFHDSAPDESLSLSLYIEKYMPSNADLCTGDCAKDIAAYIQSWENTGVGEACAPADVHYGRRQMRLLTQREYEASLYDLLGFTVVANASGIPTDTTVEGFSNQVLTSVTQDYMDAYMTIASQAAEFSEANNFAGVADCTGLSNSECAAVFVNEFAWKAYRRPLTSTEKERFQTFFSPTYSEGKNSEGLKAAIRAAISSPYFLYRFEMGERVSDLRDRISNGDKSYEPGDIGFTILPADIDGGPVYKSLSANSQWGNYYSSNAGYQYTGLDLIVLTLKATPVAGVFPTMKFHLAGTEVLKPVDSESEQQYVFVIDESFTNQSLQNGAYIQIRNEGPGTIDIKSIEFAPAVEVAQPAPPAYLDDDAYVLTQYELASFLSYAYTGSLPDAALFEAASNNELTTDTQINAQIVRLLQTEKAREHFGEFAAQWLSTDNVLSSTKNAELYPEFTTNIRKLMAQEVREIYKHVMFDGEQSVSNLYGDFTFANQSLAEFYGINGVTTTDFTKVSGLTERGGVLTSGAFMAGFAHDEETSPIKRAVAVRERMLCHTVPPMPTDIDAARDDVAAQLEAYIAANGQITNRERYAFLTKDAPCSSCHDDIINPHGFGMEDFDAVGLLRTHGVNGKAIDASGELVGTLEMTDGNRLPFTGARALSNELQSLSSTQVCFAEKGFRFVMGTGHKWFDHIADNAPDLATDEKQAYQCGINTMVSSMGENNNNARAAFSALGISDFVRYRKQR